MGMQKGWRWCVKCGGLLYTADGSLGSCPGGGTHDPNQSGQYMVAFGQGTTTPFQGLWRWCQKCQGLFFASRPGMCSAGGAHDGSQSGPYMLATKDEFPGSQGGWRWCEKCEGLYFLSTPQVPCPGGGQHDGSASSEYSVFREAAILERITLQSGTITFGGGVPVGGGATLTLFPNGDYEFSGYFHDSGATSYDVSMLWAVKSVTDTALAFNTTGRVHGTFEPGSRDYNWNLSGTNIAIAGEWDALSVQYTTRWTANATLDISILWRTIKNVIGEVTEVVTIVGKVI
jgi:hypothetical protein